ncbi:hypothetical protein Tco_1139686 [Tanacetum coccineum]
MCWVVQSDAVLRSCDAVLEIVVTASRVICDSVFSFRGEILEQCWCRSGGSYHMTYKSDYLFDFEEYDGGNILLGDGRECRVQGTGKVQGQMRDGSSFVLDNIRYVPELIRNFISLGTLEKEGFTMKT